MSIMEKAAGLVNRRPGGVADHASHADQPPNNNAPIPLQLDAFDDDGQISAGLIPYGDGADKLAVVARLDRALASAATVDQVKEIHDLAVGMAAYARKAADTQLEADAVEFRMKAARRLGELMKAQKETIGFSAGSRGSPVKGARVDDKPTLAEAGIDKTLAHEARTLAAMPEPEFRQTVEQKKAAIGKKTRKRSAASQESAFDICIDEVSAVLLKALRRLDRGQHRRLRSSLHSLVDDVIDSEIESTAKASAKSPKAKPRRKPKPRRRSSSGGGSNDAHLKHVEAEINAVLAGKPAGNPAG